MTESEGSFACDTCGIVFRGLHSTTNLPDRTVQIFPSCAFVISWKSTGKKQCMRCWFDEVEDDTLVSDEENSYWGAVKAADGL